DELISLLCRAFLDTTSNTVMAKPTFTQYRHNSLIEGAEVREVSTVDGYHDLDGMLNQVDEHTNIVWICAPDNPSGTLISEMLLKEFLNEKPNRTLVVLEEAYMNLLEKIKSLIQMDY